VNFLEVINIASKFDAKGFKQAETALGKLASTTKKLAGAAGIAYGAAAITAYGKAAVKAFAQDEAAALRLNRAVENLGIGFANPAIADYISKLEKSAAVADDILRPAFQGLLTTTGSLTQSQKLLNDAITISRASGIDLATVTEDLGKGYIGITKGLVKYNTGLSRAELQTKSFNELLGIILKRSAGAAEDYLGTTAYKFDVLSVASNNASEIIGGGLVDAFALIGGGTDATDAANAIETIATALAKVTVQSGRTIGVIPTLIKNLKNLPSQIFAGFAGKQFGVNIVPPVKKAETKLTLTEVKQQKLLAKLEAESIRREKERLALKNKQNTADKLKLAIAKANLALGKGGNIFDMDAIQLNAAMINQAEQLGKATNAAQVLAITNDIARLRVKQDILELEKAIASGDEAAITAATKKLNEDLKILGTLQQQSVKLLDIKSILETLLPKDLINLQNLKDAIALLAQIAASNLAKPAGTPSFTPTTGTVAAAIAARAGTDVSGVNDPRVAYGGQRVDSAGNYVSYNPDMAAAFSAAAGRAGASNTTVNVTVNAGVGDPNAIAEAINQVLQDAVDRGTLRGGSY
jgi:hypothetical protein